MKRTITLLLWALLFVPQLSNSQSFLSADGKQIINEEGQEVILKGWNLGNWLLQEGWMIGGTGQNPELYTQSEMRKKYHDQGLSYAEVEAFYQSWRDNYITKADIDFIASKGYNVVRVPLHYELFLTSTQRAIRHDVIVDPTKYETYKSSLATWVSNDQIASNPTVDAFVIIDNLLQWASDNDMFVVLDMHAAPGGQGRDRAISDPVAEPLDLFLDVRNQDVLVSIWDKISQRYKDNASVAMYNLINEPNWHGGEVQNEDLRDLYERIINVIRTNNDNHLVLLEGSEWGNNYWQLEPAQFTYSDNLVYSIHIYHYAGFHVSPTATFHDPRQLNWLGNADAFRNEFNVPLWIGETGCTEPFRMKQFREVFDQMGIGWAFWSYKWQTLNFNWGLGLLPGGNWESGWTYAAANGISDMNQVLESIKFENMSVNSEEDFWIAVDPGEEDPDPNPNPNPIPVGDPLRIQAQDYSAMVDGSPSLEVTEDVDGEFNMGHIGSNDWFDYNVNVPRDGSYFFRIRHAGDRPDGSGINVYSNNNLLASVALPSTGGWQTWQTSEHANVIQLIAGNQTIRLESWDWGFNYNWFELQEAGVPSKDRMDEMSQLQLYPNPFNSYLNIESGDRQIYRIEIRDLSSKLLYVQEINNEGEFLSINTSFLDAGMYFISIVDSNGLVTTHKVIKY